MVTDLATMLFDKLGLLLKPDDSKWMANSLATEEWRRQGQPPLRVPATGNQPSHEADQVDVMRILGVYTDSEGWTSCAVDHRLATGQRKWAMCKWHLCQKST